MVSCSTFWCSFNPPVSFIFQGFQNWTSERNFFRIYSNIHYLVSTNYEFELDNDSDSRPSQDTFRHWFIRVTIATCQQSFPLFGWAIAQVVT